MTDFRKLFKPEDFEKSFLEYYTIRGIQKAITVDDAVRIAQNILNQALKHHAVEVFGYELSKDGTHRNWGTERDDYDTHKALLICLEPIKECEHKFVISILENEGQVPHHTGYRCNDCGVELFPTGFKVKE